MRAFLATTCILTGALLAGGCATKKYVRNTAAPIQAKVDEVGTQTTQNSQQIQDTRTELKTVDESAKAASAPHRNGQTQPINTPGLPINTLPLPTSMLERR